MIDKTEFTNGLISKSGLVGLSLSVLTNETVRPSGTLNYDRPY